MIMCTIIDNGFDSSQSQHFLERAIQLKGHRSLNRNRKVQISNRSIQYQIIPERWVKSQGKSSGDKSP